MPNPIKDPRRFTQPLKNTFAAALAAPALLASASAHAAVVSHNFAWTGDADHSLRSFATVVNGVSNSSFFQLNFDTATETLFGGINTAGGTVAAGVQFFNGTVGGLLRLRENIDAFDNSNLLDSSNPGRISVTRAAQIPELGSLALCLGALLALGVQTRRRRGWSSSRQ